MIARFARIKKIFWIILLVEIFVLLLTFTAFKEHLGRAFGILAISNVLLIFTLLEILQDHERQRVISISKVLGDESQYAFQVGKIGLMTYDQDYSITWVSEYLDSILSDVIGRQVTSWLTETQELFQSQRDQVIVTIDNYIFEVSRSENSQMLIFRDITEYTMIKDLSHTQQVVIGLIHLDNYEETAQYADDKTMTLIDANIRQAIIDFLKDRGIFVRRLKADRLLIVLNEGLFLQLIQEKFPVMKMVRDTAEELDVAISLSIGIAKGTNEFNNLDDMVNHALALAQSRGGDQVAIKSYGEDVTYIGGNIEAIEKRSKVRARVIAQTLKELIIDSSNVIIMGHKEMDFDCFGSALAMSSIALSYDKPTYVLSNSGGIEAKLERAYQQNLEELSERHHFINENQALHLANEDTLVVIVDHHSALQSSVPSLIDKVKKVAVIDHHRRRQDFTFNPVLVYIETSASSCSELCSELIAYQAKEVKIDSGEATLILTGIVIDTNGFKNRTGSRTFEVASLLKQYGADPARADEFLKDDYDTFSKKTKILKNMSLDKHGIAIACLDDTEIASRSILSQTADTMLSIKHVEASFALARIDEKTVAISARSNGLINVHAIIEKMSGGGHFSAAALQREASSVSELLSELNDKIALYFIQEGVNNENNPVG